MKENCCCCGPISSSIFGGLEKKELISAKNKDQKCSLGI